MEEEASSQNKALPISGRGKEKVGESTAAPESWVEEVYRRREVLPFRHDTLFTDLGHKGLITRFNRATSHLIGKLDVDHLESLSPCDLVRQMQASAAEVTSFTLFLISSLVVDFNFRSFADFSKVGF